MPTSNPLRAVGRRAGEALAQAVGTLYEWQARATARHHLMTLEPRLLKDIGLSRADALGEASKPFWRP